MPMLIMWRGDERIQQSRPGGSWLEVVVVWSVLFGCCALFWYSVIMWVTG